MATYKKNMIMRALSFWKTKLDESKKETVESEEDQKKEAAKEQADEEQAEIDAADEGTGDAGEDTAGDEDLGFDPDADFDQAMDGDGSDEGEAEDDTGSDTAGETGDDASEDDDDGKDAGDDESEDDDEDAGEDKEDSADEDAGDDGEESEFRLEITAPSKKLLDAIPDLCKKFGSKVSVTVAGLDPEGDDEEGGYVTAIECQDEETLNAVKEEDAVKEAVGGMDGELNESLQYEPNTVGAVVKLLGKSDPRDFLFIRLAPNMKQCMIYDIDRKVMAEGQSTTYLEIAIGDPNK